MDIGANTSPLVLNPTAFRRTRFNITAYINELRIFVTDNLLSNNKLLPNYEASRQKEISGLLERGVFRIVKRLEIPTTIRIFGSKFVDNIKFKGIAKAFEKSRLVVQAYNDSRKR